MYYINERLIRGISQLFGMTRREFSSFAMNSVQLYGQRMTLWSRLSVTDIIMIANATHIPMRHFFVDSEKGYIPRKKEEIVYSGKWQDITVNIPFIEYVYNHDDKYSRAGIKQSMGVTEVALYNWFKRKSFNMKAQQACDFCNYFGCDLKNIINDPNDLIPSVSSTTTKSTPADVKDKDLPPIEQRQQELEDMVKNLSKQVSALAKGIKAAEEEAAIANAKLKVAESTKRPTLFVCETEDEYKTPYRWQASKWTTDDDVPTIAALVKHCNDAGENILQYITKANVIPTEDAAVAIAEERLTTLLHLAGKDTTADTLLASQFCSLLNECKLTPASVLDVAYLVPTFPDKLLRMIAER